MKFSFVQLRFIPSDSCAKEKDHIVHIKRNDDDYLWFYKDECRNVQTIVTSERENIFLYLKNCLELLQWDKFPYSGIQVFAPGFPTVLIGMKQSLMAFKDLKNLLNNVFDNWAENMTKDELNDLDGDNANESLLNDEEDEEDDPDMPALIPINTIVNTHTGYTTPNRPTKCICPPPIRKTGRLEANPDADAPALNTRSQAHKKQKLEEDTPLFRGFWS